MSNSMINSSGVSHETSSTPIRHRQPWDRPGTFLRDMPFGLRPVPTTPGFVNEHDGPLVDNGMSPMKFRADDMPFLASPTRFRGEYVGQSRSPHSPATAVSSSPAPRLNYPVFIPHGVAWRQAGPGTLAPAEFTIQELEAFLSGFASPSPPFPASSNRTIAPPQASPLTARSLLPPIEIDDGADGDMDVQLGEEVDETGSVFEQAPDSEAEDSDSESCHPASQTTCEIHSQQDVRDGSAAAASQGECLTEIPIVPDDSIAGLPFPTDRTQLCNYLAQGLSLCSLFASKVVSSKVICSASLELVGGQWKDMAEPCLEKKFTNVENYQRHVKSSHIHIPAAKGGDHRGNIGKWVRRHASGLPLKRESKTLVVIGALPRSSLPARKSKTKTL